MKRVLRIAGKVDGIIKFAIFGNELYRRNEALRQAYADLEETGRQRDELQNERVALLSSAAYGDFASTIAHELRSPLTVVVDRLKKMQRRLERGKAIPPQDLESALHGAGMIAQQLNQMEDYAQQRDEMASYDVNPFVIKMARYYDFKLRKAGFEFHFYDREGNSVIDEQGNPLPDATSQVAMVNPALFNFVLKNLFENAFQFARPDSRRIDIRTYECDDRIYFEFKDYGTGIPEDIQQRVFEPRFTTRDEPGIHGMGLSTVKSNIERMNGQISLESRLGEYTTFTISFEKAKTY
ncbi:HAMP domain-containing histidine kinase [Candidatus Woesearchaeota archaeon]|nr:HAMP domain-containing histidine kinase [Candidatus Woesearchaeota archaeon]